jgi:hypothetical protein
MLIQRFHSKWVKVCLNGHTKFDERYTRFDTIMSIYLQTRTGIEKNKARLQMFHMIHLHYVITVKSKYTYLLQSMFYMRIQH